MNRRETSKTETRQLILAAAYLEGNVRGGLLSGFAVLFALAADFFLVPALLTFVYGRKKKSNPAQDIC